MSVRKILGLKKYRFVCPFGLKFRRVGCFFFCFVLFSFFFLNLDAEKIQYKSYSFLYLNK